jgi:hypothetical protein
MVDRIGELACEQRGQRRFGGGRCASAGGPAAAQGRGGFFQPDFVFASVHVAVLHRVFTVAVIECDWYGCKPIRGNGIRMADWRENLPEMKPGEVWLVGAGPGDPGLLTLHAANALSQADVIVHDALVNAVIASSSRAPARCWNMPGNVAASHLPNSATFRCRLVELARVRSAGPRLKGGDPFVFGRGGEEALTLVEHHIPFRIVPGVTAGNRRTRLCRHSGDPSRYQSHGDVSDRP